MPRVYLDLDVLNFASRIPKVSDDEKWKFSEAERIITLARHGKIKILTSWIAIETSLERASEDIKRLCLSNFEKILRSISEVREPSFEELSKLAGEYLTAKAITKEENAIHIGAASLAGADYFLTWDEEHILKEGVQQKVDRINRKYGLKTPKFVRPEDFVP